MEQYPRNVQQEEPTKELLAQMYKELGARLYHIHKEKQVDVYLPRIDLLSILRDEQISYFEGTLFQYLRPVVCFEVHDRSLEKSTFAKWQIELLGLYHMIAGDLAFDYKDFVGFSILEHMPENVFSALPKEVIIPVDPYSQEQPCVIKILGMIPWYFILKPRLRYDLFCLPANLMVPERYPQLITEIKQRKYNASPSLEEMAVKVLDWYFKSKGETSMLDIGSVLEKSQDPSFVRFRECRDMLVNEGKLEAKRSTLLRILEKQCGPVPKSLQEKIAKLEDINKFDELIDQAISIKSIGQLKI